MATAGRILIIPKGAWSAETGYELLDLVHHNGVAWMAKKESIGIEPKEENSEWWANVFGSEFLTLQNFPSLEEIGAAKAEEHTIKTFGSLEEIGLVSGEETIERITEALDERIPCQLLTTVHYNSDNTPYPYPYNDGLLKVISLTKNKAIFEFVYNRGSDDYKEYAGVCEYITRWTITDSGTQVDSQGYEFTGWKQRTLS